MKTSRIVSYDEPIPARQDTDQLCCLYWPFAEPSGAERVHVIWRTIA
jgi:hypothetical protein